MAGFDVAGARKAGYSDAEIVDHLKENFDVEGAKKAGYSDAEILAHLTGADKNRSVLSAPAAGYSSAVSGLADTAEVLGATDVAKTLKGHAERVAPKNYESPKFVGAGSDTGEGLASKIGRTAVEGLPMTAAALAAMRATPGPWWAKALTGAGVGLAATLGPRAKEVAQQEGNTETPTSAQTLKAAPVAAAESVIGALPGLRIVGGAPSRTVAGALGKGAVTAGAEGAAGAGRSVVHQAGIKGEINPEEVANEAITQAVQSSPFVAGKTVRTASEARKYGGFHGDNERASIEVARDLEAQGNIHPGAATGVFNAKTKPGFDAVRNVADETHIRLAEAARQEGQMAPPVEVVVNRARAGHKINARDASLVDQSVSPELAHLVRKASVVAMLKEQGNWNEHRGTFTGGISGAIGKLVTPANIGKGVLAAGLGQLVGPLNVIAYSPHAIAAGAGAYGLGRLIDRYTGNINPASRFAKRFSQFETPGGIPAQGPIEPPITPTGRDPNMGPWGPFAPTRGAAGIPNIARPPEAPPTNVEAGVLPKMPPEFAKTLMAQVKAINREDKRAEAEASKSAAEKVRQAALVSKLLSKLNKTDTEVRAVPETRPAVIERPYVPRPGAPDVVNAGAPSPMQALPPAGGPIWQPGPTQPKLLPPPSVIYQGGPPEQKLLPPPAPAPEPVRAPVLSREDMARKNMAMQIANLHNERVRLARLQAAMERGELPRVAVRESTGELPTRQPRPVRAPEVAPEPVSAQAPVPAAPPAARPAATAPKLVMPKEVVAAKVLAQQPKPATPAPVIPEDLSIPDFLRRAPKTKPANEPAKPQEPALKTPELPEGLSFKTMRSFELRPNADKKAHEVQIVDAEGVPHYRMEVADNGKGTWSIGYVENLTRKHSKLAPALYREAARYVEGQGGRLIGGINTNKTSRAVLDQLEKEGYAQKAKPSDAPNLSPSLKDQNIVRVRPEKAPAKSMTWEQAKNTFHTHDAENGSVTLRSHSASGMTPRAAAEHIADNLERQKGGYKYKTDRADFVKATAGRLAEKAKMARAISRITGLPEEKVTAHLWASDRKEAYAWKEELMQAFPTKASQIAEAMASSKMGAKAFTYYAK